MRRMKMALLAAATVVALAGCRIETVFDHEAAGQELDFVTELAALPGGGFAAYDCAYDGAWAGSGLYVVRPGAGAAKVLGCGEAVDVAALADGRLLLSFGEWPVTPRIEALDPENGSREVVFDPATLADEVTLGQLAVAGDGTVYVGATLDGVQQILRVTGPTTAAAVPGTEGLGQWDFIVGTDGTITSPSVYRVVEVAPDGARRTVAGTGVSGFSGDGGPATRARLASLTGLDRTADGGLLIVDSGNARVRRIDAEGRIWTVAGGGTSTEEGVSPTDAQLHDPTDVAVAGSCWYVADGPYFDTKVRSIGGGLCPDFG